METGLFQLVCEHMGYDPADVLSVRLNSRRVVVVATDASGEMVSNTYPSEQRRAVGREAGPGQGSDLS
jgi:hypothetical protein